MQITATKELERMVRLAFEMGCDQQQLGRFITAGYIPQPRQLEFHTAANECNQTDGPSRIGYGGTRGQAKSHAVFAQAVLDDMQAYPNLKFLYLRKVQRRAIESSGDLRVKILAHTPHAFKNNIVHLPNGSRLIMGGFNNENEIDSYLGIEYDGAVIEDATTLSKSKHEAIEGSIRTSRDDWRPRIYESANPGGIGHGWYRQLFINPYTSGRETSTRFIHTTLGDNIYIDKEYNSFLDGLSGWLRRAWRDGDFTIAAGQYFINWNERKHVKTFETESHWTYWGAMDYGFNHWLVFLLMAQDDDGNIYCIDEHAERRWLAPRHSDAIKALLERHRIKWLSSIVAGHDCFAARGTDKTIAEEYDSLGLTLQKAEAARKREAKEAAKRERIEAQRAEARARLAKKS
jgi:phage terminase large subunit